MLDDNENTSLLLKYKSNNNYTIALGHITNIYKSSAVRQKSIKNLFKGGAIKETMGRLISKFFIYESVEPHKAYSYHLKNMIVGAQQAGM